MHRGAARPILIIAAIAAVPALAQVQTSSVAGVARTTATTRIEQPATLTNSQDLMFAVQTPIAASLAITPRISSPAAAAALVSANSPSAAGSAPPSSTPTASSLVRNASSSLTAAVPSVSQATFTVAGEGGQAISVTVPPTVDLARNGGAETAVLTTSNSLGEGPQFLGGSFAGGGTLSFAVGGQVTLASSNVSSGTYDGLLAVVAQYN